MKKLLSVLIIIVLVSKPFIVYGMTSEYETKVNELVCSENLRFSSSDILCDIGEISIKNSIVINGKKSYCYPTFDDKEEALKNIKLIAPAVLKELSDKYNLRELCVNNWNIYYIALQKNWSKYIDMYPEETKKLLSFFDIYENDLKNDEILNFVCNDVYDQKNLLSVLPNNSSNVLSKTETYSSGFNIDDAIHYAMIYAVNPNTSDYEVFDADCTNFASQILEYGGVSQVKTLSKLSGWWHTKNGNSHEYSYSWTLATKFCYYHVVDYKTKSHYDFTCNLKKGDFICIDFYNDLDWDHVGFVVEVDDYLTNGYYDYRVAQHSDNYLAWTSSDTNGWEQVAGYSTYGIIRK